MVATRAGEGHLRHVYHADCFGPCSNGAVLDHSKKRSCAARASAKLHRGAGKNRIRSMGTGLLRLRIRIARIICACRIGARHSKLR
jgi:hypothetical protein